MTIAISDLGPTEFENLIFDLAQSLGLKNAIWRTPGRDGGRDIQGEWHTQDFSGHTNTQVWYLECKHYESSVGWPMVWEKISFAESNGADVLLFAVTSSLSPQAIDEVNKWNANKKAPAIRFWNGFDISNKLKLFPLIAIKFSLTPDPRKEVGGALLPSVNLLLKYSIAAHSAEVFGTDPSSKHAVLYSLSELISARLAEVESKGQFSVAPFRSSSDGFEWLENSEILESSGADRYSIRVVAAYVKDFMRAKNIQLLASKTDIYFELSRELPNNAIDDLHQISLLSNFEITQASYKLIIRVR